eukprot:1189905-Prorocentrum_minimum.AAC.3
MGRMPLRRQQTKRVASAQEVAPPQESERERMMNLPKVPEDAEREESEKAPRRNWIMRILHSPSARETALYLLFVVVFSFGA